MKILHTVEYYDPSSGGAQEVIKRISEELVKRGHELTIATTKIEERKSLVINGVTVVEFDFANPDKDIASHESTRYQQWLIDSSFDVMMNYSLHVKTTDLVFPLLKQIKYPKILNPCGLFALYNPNYRPYYAALADIMKQYTTLIFHSDQYRDANFARKNGITNYVVIPNGASESEFSHSDINFRKKFLIPETTPLLISIGNHTGLKGHDLIIRSFLQAKIGSATLLILGRKLDEYNLTGCTNKCQIYKQLVKVLSFGNKQLLLLSLPREDVVSALYASDIFLFGSMIEASPIVLFEAMASKTPFITTGCGNAAEIAQWSESGIVIPTRELSRPRGFVTAKSYDMARAIENLIQDPEKRLRLAENGYNNWVNRFTWEKIALQYETLYEKILS